MNILGITGAIGRDGNITDTALDWWIHGSGAALICEGTYIGSVSEERFSRIKIDGNFPYNSIQYLLDKAGIGFDQVDQIGYVTGCGHPDVILARDSDYVKNFMRNLFPNASYTLVDHHLAHASASYYTSGFEEANVFTFDGAGNSHPPLPNDAPNNSSYSMVSDYGKRWVNIQNTYYNKHGDLPGMPGMMLGEFYSLMSAGIWCLINKDRLEELEPLHQHRDKLDGKVMGLCAYGNASNVKDLFENPFRVLDSSCEHMMPRIDGSVERFQKLLDTTSRMIDGYRESCDPADLAAWVQGTFEQTVLEYLNRIPQSYKLDNLCLGGGCALNILANSKIAAQSGYQDVHVYPATGDEGLATGAALRLAHSVYDRVHLPHNLATVGPSYTDDQILEVLDNEDQITHVRVDDEELFRYTADRLANNNIVAWHQGQSEHGPRALGNRSILANPSYDNKDLLNTKVKFREHWRPYAAIILQEDLHEWIDIPKKSSDYMLFAGLVRPDKRTIVPCITHNDTTCRMQTVTPQLNERAYRLIQAFKSKTNIPMLLNTSFNTIPGEPIVETPRDAVRSFLYSQIDVLVINNFIVHRKEQ